MKTTVKTILHHTTIVLALFAGIHQAAAQGTAFTYQGRLNSGGNPASGSYDMAFTLYATNVTGTAIAGPVTNTAVTVTNGLFTTLVNFTNGFGGGSNWLQIAVSPSGSNSFGILLPRQQLTPVPYAIFSESASNVLGTVPGSGLSGNYVNPVTMNNPGDVFGGNGNLLTSLNASAFIQGTVPAFALNNAWRTVGNTNANPTNGMFLGTADNLPLEVLVNNQRVLRLESVNDGGFAHPVVNVIGGYVSNSVAAGVDGATIAGGGGSDINFGWVPNTVITSFGTIGGGFGNTAGGLAGTIGGGYYNVTGPGTITGVEFVGGGYTNVASGDAAAIVGGEQNTASGTLAIIGGGDSNLASGTGAFIGGGGYDGTSVAGSTASGNASVVGGGLGNQAAGSYATVPGGAHNVAGGQYSFAAGQQAQALNAGAFVWADSLGGAFTSTSSNQFLIRAQGGVGIGTASPAKQLDVTSSAPGVPTNSSVDPSVFVRINNQASDGTIPSSDVAGIGFGRNSTREAIVGATYGYDFLDFYLAGVMTTPKMRILGNGNVGIGTTTPATALQVNGTVTATSFAGNGSGLTGVALLNQPNTFAGTLTITNGNFGIGTTAPATVLQVVDSVYGALPVALFQVANCGAVCAQQDYQENIRLQNVNPNGQTGIAFITSTNSTITNVPNAWIGTDYGSSANNLKFSTESGTSLVDRVYVNGTSGDVGIGTDTPAALLDVNGSGHYSGSVGIGTAPGGAELTVKSSAFGIEQTDGNVLLSTYIDSTGGWLGTVNNYPLNFYVNNGYQSMTINTNGNVGINTTAPIGQLTVATSNGQLSIVGGPFTPELWSTGGGVPGHMRFRNALEVWPNTNTTAAGYLDVRGTNGVQNIILDGSTGNITCVAVNITSDRNAKEDFSPLNPRDVLAKVASLPITEWQYKAETAGDAAATRHIGPMAQDFHNAFTLGQDDKHISVVDEGGVALAAIQGLNQKLDEKDARIQELENSVNALKALVNQLAAQQAGGAK